MAQNFNTHFKNTTFRNSELKKNVIYRIYLEPSLWPYLFAIKNCHHKINREYLKKKMLSL